MRLPQFEDISDDRERAKAENYYLAWLNMNLNADIFEKQDMRAFFIKAYTKPSYNYD